MKKNVVILAAGKGTRMQASIPKVLHKICGIEMINLIIDTLDDIKIDKTIAVLGYKADKVKEILPKYVDVAIQEKQLGTANAISATKDLLTDNKSMTLIISGDTPLLKKETIVNLFNEHENNKNDMTILTAIKKESFGYGRIVRDSDNTLTKIVEEKDATEDEKNIHEINTGIYVFDNERLFSGLKKISNNNKQNEYYLTDILGILKEDKYKVGSVIINDEYEILGINDKKMLSNATEILQSQINEKHMNNGVNIIDPKNTYIDKNVKIKSGTIIEPNVYIKGNTKIGNNVTITMGSQINDCEIDDNVIIKNSYLESSKIKENADIGPYAHLRPNTIIDKKAHVGNFVELKNTYLGKNSKIGHLSYAGDAEIEEEVNIGAGTIFVNYDGINKHKTKIGKRSFIGSNTKLIAPLNIGEESITAAGSTINKDIPKHGMGIARNKQSIKENYWIKSTMAKKYIDK